MLTNIGSPGGPIKEKRYPPLSDQVALDIVKRCTTNGQVMWTPHFKSQMRLRKILMSDVLNVFDNGRISRPPEWNEECGEYIYFVTEKDIEGTELTLKIAISEEKDMITLITLY
jgi:hypothetical protein